MATAKEPAKPLDDSSPMPLGKWKDKPLVDVPAWHLLWLIEQEWFIKNGNYKALRQYIYSNKDVLQAQVKAKKG